MASSFNNRHWPSMFRSKHAAEPWQAQPDISGSPPPSSLLSGGGGGSCLNKHTSSGYAGGEERTPDPKPRWNPRPEQIRILEAIFNSGMINPPRDEIPRIRMRLQEYGQVGDANVFYWFQNRKSRSKNKLRAAGSARPSSFPTRAPARAAAAAAAVTPAPPPPPPPHPAPPQLLTTTQQVQLLASPPVPQAPAPTSSSSSSSDRSSGSSRPAAKRAAQAMSPAAAMDLLGPLAAACPQMYYQGQPVAPPASAPAHKVHDLVASDEPILQPWPQGCCLSAAELAAILGGQYMHVPAVPGQQQPPPPALPAGAFLRLCNEVTGPAITDQRTCAGWGPGLGQYCPGGGADHHQLGKNTDAAPAREVAHEDATKLGLLQYCFGDDNTAVDAATGAATTPDAAVTVACVAATATTAGLTGLPASSAPPNSVVANYDLMQLQGLTPDDGDLVGAGAAAATTGAPVVTVATAAVAEHAQEMSGGVAALCITDSVTGRSVAHSVAAARLDVRAQFGEAAVLLRCAGDRGQYIEHVPVDASGCTVQPLQHGAFYYVLV